MPDGVISYPRYRFPPTIISHAVWLYYRFTLSFRDVEDLLAQRGITLSYETVRHWCQTFASPTRDGSGVTEGPSATRAIWTSCS
jgi:transposase-like protein